MFPLVLAAAGDSDAAFRPAVFGLELPVHDVAATERAYTAAFGFAPVLSGGEVARLAKDGLALVLVRSDAPLDPAGAANVHLNLAAHDLAAAVERALAAGFTTDDPELHANPIGRAVTVVDADGHATNLIELRTPSASADALTVFNLGLNLEAAADWEFVERLGYRVLTRGYLPDALPIERAGAAELVLHREARGPRTANARSAALLLAVDALEPAVAELAARGFADAAALPRPSFVGRRATLRAPSDVRIELVERSPAQLAFERIEALAGSWEGRSSAGWTARIDVEVIARGSAVLERSNFEAHPGETMLTLFHRDGPALVLTHYCVAGKQPRLVASEIGADALELLPRGPDELDGGHPLPPARRRGAGGRERGRVLLRTLSASPAAPPAAGRCAPLERARC